MAQKSATSHPSADAPRVADVALEIAQHGDESAKFVYSPQDVERARVYLATLASEDGRVALGKSLLLIQSVASDAYEKGDLKLVVEAAARKAELLKLAEFAEVDATARAESSQREERALAYLRSTGLVPDDVDAVEEAARLVAQYVVDKLLEFPAHDSPPEKKEPAEKKSRPRKASPKKEPSPKKEASPKKVAAVKKSPEKKLAPRKKREGNKKTPSN